jgi:hypothetical protein
MARLLQFLRFAIFVAIAPIIAVLIVFMFVMPYNWDWLFSRKRKQEAVDVWRKLSNWVSEGRYAC